MDRRFLVARNPDRDSRLPYLIRIPLGDHGLVLKSRDTWPRTSKVYCHRADAWPDDAEVLDDVGVRSCIRRGAAIDLVLSRARENRSQIVFTTLKGGREGIFWQTPRTARQARPGVRIPTRRPKTRDLTIFVDTRERYPFKFAQRRARTERLALPAGDYGVEVDGELVAAVERKSLANLVQDLVDGSLPYQLADLASLPHAAVAVEDRYSRLFKLDRIQPGWVPELLARVQVRYSAVPIVFCETRALAEEWTYQFLVAAAAASGELPA